MPEIAGRVFDVQRFCLHDGPGIRTTVFLKGCPLRCVWCHNPEGMSARRQLGFSQDQCLACGACVPVCAPAGRRIDDGRLSLNRTRCTACGACAACCPTHASEIIGRDVGVAELLDEVLKDRAFHETSGGGLTISGGEPLMQAQFTAALLSAAGSAGVHRTVETCGHGDTAALLQFAKHAELFLFDVKETDPQRHIAFTGVGNRLILQNLRLLHAAGARILLRLPIIPGLNDRDDHFRAVADLCRELPGLIGVEPLPYHALGEGKRNRLGPSSQPMPRTPSPDPQTVAAWERRLAELGVGSSRQ